MRSIAREEDSSSDTFVFARRAGVFVLIALIFEELLNVVLPVGVFEIALPVLL